MSVEVDKASVACTTCGVHVSELRRGRCWSCYTQWADLRPVGRGACCSVCQERRRDHLRLVELHNRSIPLCHLCAARAIRLGSVPPSIEGLREALRRDRRAVERRSDGLDRRIFPRERRASDRRDEPEFLARPEHTDLDNRVPEFDDLIIEIEDRDIEEIEQTVVKARPLGRTSTI